MGNIYIYKDKKYQFIQIVRNKTDDKDMVLYKDDCNKKYVRDLSDFNSKFKKVATKDYAFKDFLFTNERISICNLLRQKGFLVRTEKIGGFHCMVANLDELKSMLNSLRDYQKESISNKFSYSPRLKAIQKIERYIGKIEKERV